MMADMQVQVWLDTLPGSVPAVVVPYVQIDRDAQLTYRTRLVKEGASGSSSITQSAEVHARGGTPRPLAGVRAAPGPGDLCHIDVELREGSVVRGRFRFACPR